MSVYAYSCMHVCGHVFWRRVRATPPTSVPWEAFGWRMYACACGYLCTFCLHAHALFSFTNAFVTLLFIMPQRVHFCCSIHQVSNGSTYMFSMLFYLCKCLNVFFCSEAESTSSWPYVNMHIHMHVCTYIYTYTYMDGFSWMVTAFTISLVYGSLP